MLGHLKYESPLLNSNFLNPLNVQTVTFDFGHLSATCCVSLPVMYSARRRPSASVFSVSETPTPTGNNFKI